MFNDVMEAYLRRIRFADDGYAEVISLPDQQAGSPGAPASIPWHHERMAIESSWPALRAQTREWLVNNNGDVVPTAIVHEIATVGGPAATDSWWVREDGAAGGVSMPDEAVDWIETSANAEGPSGDW